MRNKVFLLLIFLVFGTNVYSASVNEVPLADSGIINIGDFDFHNNDILLHGNWEFFWDTLIFPEGFDTLSDRSIMSYIRVPSAWSSKQAGSHPIKGKATYRLLIRTGEMKGTYAIRLYDHFTASRVWFDDRLIYHAGKPGNSKKTSIPDFVYADVPVFIDGTNPEHELIIQISNFHHNRSGLTKPVKFGTFNRLTDQSRKWLITILLVVGVILFISANHLLNYFLYKNEITHLIFGLLCLVMIIRNISSGQRILTYLFTDINWQLLFKLDNFSGFGTIPLFAIFLSVLYPKEFPKFLLYLFVGIGAAITLFVFVTPQIIYGKYRMFYELYVLTGGLFLTFFVLLRAALRKREGSLLTFIGFFILYSTAINDVLISMGLIGGSEVAPYGLLVYMLVQSFVLSRGTAFAIKENRKLSLALQEETQNLENRVMERTRELEIRNQEVISQQEILKNQSWHNESLARISTILNKYSNQGLKILCRHIIQEILEIIGAQVGVIYLINDDRENPRLELLASRNASKELLNSESVSPGEGLLGACFMDRKMKIINNLSESYVRLDSGLGTTVLQNLILIPMFINQESLGVIEIAAYTEFDDKYVRLLEEIGVSVSATIHSLRLNIINRNLLKEYEERESILTRNEEEMRQNLEELQALREALDTIKKKKE